MKAGVRKSIFSGNFVSNNLETVVDRWLHVARRFASMAMSFCPCKI